VNTWWRPWPCDQRSTSQCCTRRRRAPRSVSVGVPVDIVGRVGDTPGTGAAEAASKWLSAKVVDDAAGVPRSTFDGAAPSVGAPGSYW
jgi:hypothetical protein